MCRIADPGRGFDPRMRSLAGFCKLQAQQDKERQKLQQKQEQDHQRMTQQKADDARKQQLEQQHHQQTQQLQQKHAQQQQKLQERQQPPPRQNPSPKPPKEKLNSSFAKRPGGAFARGHASPVSSPLTPSYRLGRGRWTVAAENNLETDERHNFAIESATRAARMDKVRARNHLAHTGGRSGASTDLTSLQALDDAPELEI